MHRVQHAGKDGIRIVLYVLWVGTSQKHESKQRARQTVARLAGQASAMILPRECKKKAREEQHIIWQHSSSRMKIGTMEEKRWTKTINYNNIQWCTRLERRNHAKANEQQLTKWYYTCNYILTKQAKGKWESQQRDMRAGTTTNGRKKGENLRKIIRQNHTNWKKIYILHKQEHKKDIYAYYFISVTKRVIVHTCY